LPDALISDCASYHHFVSHHMFPFQILPDVLPSNFASCPPSKHYHMPIWISPHASHAVIHSLASHPSFISCCVILPLSSLMTRTPVRSRDMPSFQVWPHALLLDLALYPPLISWPLPFFYILLHATLQIMPHAFDQVLPHALLSYHVTPSFASKFVLLLSSSDRWEHCGFLCLPNRPLLL